MSHNNQTPDPNAELVSVFSTTEFGVVPIVRSVLDAAGIDYMVSDTGISNEIMGQRTTMSIGETAAPMTVMVRAEDEVRALDALRDFIMTG